MTGAQASRLHLRATETVALQSEPEPSREPHGTSLAHRGNPERSLSNS